MTITEPAVVQRIRRKLRNTAQMLRKSRGEQQQMDCGRFYVIDTNLNALLGLVSTKLAASAQKLVPPTTKRTI